MGEESKADREATGGIRNKFLEKDAATVKEAKRAERITPLLEGSGGGPGSILNSIEDPGFVLFIAGLLTFAFVTYLGNAALALVINTFFLLYTSIFIFKGKGILVTVTFAVWYLFYGGTLVLPATLSFSAFLYTLAYTFGLPLLIGMLVHGLFNKITEKNFTEAAVGELVGLVPVLFFFLELGLLPLLTKKFNLPVSSLTQNVLLFTPWWAFLGLFTTKKRAWLITLFKAICLFYIISLILVVPANTYAAYKSSLPTPEELLKAKESLEKQLPQKENPALSNLICVFEDPANFQACINKRQEASEIKYTCKELNKLTPGSSAYNDCIKKEQEKKKQNVNIGGSLDPTIKQATEIKLEIEEEEKYKTMYFKAGTESLKVPAQLKIKNPSKEKIRVKIFCDWEKGSEKIKGEISPKEAEAASGTFKEISDEEINKNILCSLPSTAKLSEGTYSLTYTVQVYDLQSTSRLTRIFIGSKNYAEKVELAKKLKTTYFLDKGTGSLSAKDPVRINFALGEPVNDPIIESTDNVLLRADAEKTGEGELLKITSYAIDLSPIPFSSCFQGKGIDFKEKKSFLTQNYPLAACFVTLPNELKNPGQEYVVKEFTANLVYDYQIQKKINLVIT